MIATLLVLQMAAQPAARGAEIVVAPGSAVPTLTVAVARARPGDRIVVQPGRYVEPMIEVRVPRVTIEGRGWPEFTGSDEHTVLVIAADSVTVRGLVVSGTGRSDLDDRAGILVRDASTCLIEGNRLRDTFFGIYLRRARGCVVRGNDLRGHATSQLGGGNGIHLWYSPGNLIERNQVAGHRDGIYFEFSPSNVAIENESSASQRYGLHFMFSDSCRYVSNRFRDNASGVAVMFSRGVVIHGNRFEHAWGPASYGLLLKEILGGEITENVFEGNSSGVHMEGASRMVVRGNTFLRNGWAVRVLASAESNEFTGNRFIGNAFDVVTNSRSATSEFDRNWWDAYRGYDLDRDGVGDTPFRPVRLFGLIVEQHPTALVLLRSPMVALLDAAERVLPVLTPDVLVDRNPLMRPPE